MEISELQALCDLVFNQRDKTDEKKKEYQAENEKLEKLEARLLSALEEHNLKSFKSEFGTVGVRDRFSVKVPQGEARQQFFNYLKEKGEFDELITVNSQTLNGWYKEEQEKAKNNNQFLYIPGLDVPITTKSIYMKKEK